MRVVSGDPLTTTVDNCGSTVSRGNSRAMPTGAGSTPVATFVPRPGTMSGGVGSGGRASRPGIPSNRKPKVTTTLVSKTSRPSSPSSGSGSDGGGGGWGSRDNSPRRGSWGWGGFFG